MFTLLGHLGSGAYGDVYALETADGINVALKIFKTPRNSMYYQDLAREIFALSQRGHLRGIFKHGDEMCVVMPQFGPPLMSHWPFTKLTHEAVASSLKPIVNQLSSFRGMHRDVKPSNILMPWTNDPSGSLESTLVDFSISTNTNVSRDPCVVTLWYRAPEIILGMEYTNKIDVWSLGITILNLITGTQFCMSEDLDVFLKTTFDFFGLDLPSWPQARDKLKICNIHESVETTYFNQFTEPLQSLLRMCLQTNPNLRATWAEVQIHPFWALAKPLCGQDVKIRRLKNSRTAYVTAVLDSGFLFLPQKTYKPLDLEPSIAYVDYLLCYTHFSVETVAYAYALFTTAVSCGSEPSVSSLVASLFLAGSYNNELRHTGASISKWEELFTPLAQTFGFGPITNLRLEVAEVLTFACQWPRFTWPIAELEEPWMQPWAILTWKSKYGPRRISEMLRKTDLKSILEAKAA